MIARIWRSVTLISQAEYYLDYLTKVAIPSYQSAEGNQGIYILRELRDELAHFLLISFWESSEALRNFVGSDSHLVKQTAEEMEYIIAGETVADHYQVIAKIDKRI